MMGWTRIKGEDLLGERFICPVCNMAQTYGDTPFCPNCGEQVREKTAFEKELMDSAKENGEDLWP